MTRQARSLGVTTGEAAMAGVGRKLMAEVGLGRDCSTLAHHRNATRIASTFARCVAAAARAHAAGQRRPFSRRMHAFPART